MLKNVLMMLFGAVVVGLSVPAGAADPAVVIVSHDVADFGAWKKAFDAGREMRKKSGLTERYVMRDAEKPNAVIVVLEFKSLEEAKKFVSDPGFKERIKKASSTGAAEIKVGIASTAGK